MDVQPRQLRALVAVTDAGTFTDAAAELGASQAAVSRAIAGLEETLGVRLIERSTRHTALTVAGTRVLPLARQVLADLEQLRRTAQDADRGLRVGYAWSALGKHTRALQREWARDRPGVPLDFVQSNTPTAGLAEGVATVAVIRRPLADERFAATTIGTEARYAAMATDHALARRRSVRLTDLSRYVVGIDDRTGTTTMDLWPQDAQPAGVRATRGVDEWLTLIAAGQVVGITSEATAHQYPRPGVAYRPLHGAPPIDVRLVWWRADPPRHLDDLVTVATGIYQRRR